MYLVVNADDLGYADRRDDGILRTLLHNDGVATSMSLLVNGMSAENAAERILSMHESCVGVGLHINLTEGLPVAEKADVATLLDGGGCFLGKMEFRAALQDGHVDTAQVQHEIVAQLEKFRRLLGHYPHHADGHQHVHVLPKVCAVFAAALRRHGVQWTRMPVEPAIAAGNAHWLSAGQRAFLSQVSADAQRCAHVYTENGVRFSHHFIGMATMGSHMSVDRLMSGLEVLVHDARCTGERREGRECDDVAAMQRPDSTATSEHLPASVSTSASAFVSPPPASSHRRPAEEHCSQRDTSSSMLPAAACPATGQEVKGARNGTRQGAVRKCSMEVMVHPGYAVSRDEGGCGQGPDDFATSWERDHEVDVLCSKDLRGRLEQLGVELVSWRQLSEML